MRRSVCARRTHGVRTGAAALRRSAGTGAPPLAGTEHQHQAAFFEWCGWMATGELPELRWAFAVGNGGLRNPAVAGQMKAEGVKAGVNDWFLLVPRRGFGGLACEMKKPGEAVHGIGAVSAEQRQWLWGHLSNGISAHVAFGVDAARALCRWYLRWELTVPAVLTSADVPLDIASWRPPDAPSEDAISWATGQGPTTVQVPGSIWLWRPVGKRAAKGDAR